MTTQLYIRICNFLRDKIKGTQWEGHVFTVGGCCRDIALGREINDVDLAVDLPNGGIEFANWLYKMKLTTMRPVIFERYGTSMLKLKAFPHDAIEIVQTRAEKYTDHNSRNPETAFGSIYDDCMRRDLTINALYYDVTSRKLLDICGRSLNDIKNKVICTPADPDATYDDDPIRILRTIRFAAKLGWNIPSDIFEAMCRNSQRLNIIKAERLRGEFEKILLSDKPSVALEFLRACGAMNLIVPELEGLYGLKTSKTSSQTAWEHTIKTVDLVSPTLSMRWSALLADIAMPHCRKTDNDGNISFPAHERKARHYILQALVRLKYHQPLLKDVLFLTANHEATRTWGKLSEYMDDSILRKLQYLSGRPDKMDALLSLINADNNALPEQEAMPEQVKFIRQRLKEMEDDGSTMYSYHLPFAERRIKKLLHIEPGPLVEDCLEYMMRLAFENPCRSKQEFEHLVSKYTPCEQNIKGHTLVAEELRPSCKNRNKTRTPVSNAPKKRTQNRRHRRSRNKTKKSDEA